VSRKVTVWQRWDSSDPAESDSFFATKGEALADMRSLYGVKGAATRTDGRLMEWDYENAGGSQTVYIRPVEVTMTGAGVAHALGWAPNR